MRSDAEEFEKSAPQFHLLQRGSGAALPIRSIPICGLWKDHAPRTKM
jgi:hypothetical protein